jgi:hypothetical protein
MDYSFSYLLLNENTYKTHKKQVFQNKYSNFKSENFYFLLLIIINDFRIITFTNGRGEIHLAILSLYKENEILCMTQDVMLVLQGQRN